MTGCMDPTAFNYDPVAFTPDQSSCVPREWGCPSDAVATNAVATANSYDHTDAPTQCKGAYCSSDGTRDGSITERPTRVDTSSPWTCTGGAQVVAFNSVPFHPGGELPAFGECSNGLPQPSRHGLTPPVAANR